MSLVIDTSSWRPVEIEGMPHFEMAMKRVYAWFANENSTVRL